MDTEHLIMMLVELRTRCHPAQTEQIVDLVMPNTTQTAGHEADAIRSLCDDATAQIEWTSRDMSNVIEGVSFTVERAGGAGMSSFASRERVQWLALLATLALLAQAHGMRLESEAAACCVLWLVRWASDDQNLESWDSESVLSEYIWCRLDDTAALAAALGIQILRLNRVAMGQARCRLPSGSVPVRERAQWLFDEFMAKPVPESRAEVLGWLGYSH